MPRAKRADPVIEDDPDEQLDQPVETDTLTGAIPEGIREVLRPIVSKMGWTPKEEWKRDPAEWRDELQFLEDTPRVVADLKERSERTAQAAAAAIEEERRRKVEEATRVIRESEDPAEREQAAAKLRDTQALLRKRQPGWRAILGSTPTRDRACRCASARLNEMAQQGGADIRTAWQLGKRRSGSTVSRVLQRAGRSSV